jgi:hypothetical protein
VGVTPIYGFPYPALSDPPNGPAQIQALAEAVEADLAVTDANIATLNITGLTYSRVLGGKVRTTNASATSGSTELQVLDTGSVSLPASSRFLIHVFIVAGVSAVGDEYDFRIRDTNVVGTQRQEVVTFKTDNAVPYTVSYGYIHTTTTSDTRTWVATATRLGGTGTCTVNASSYMTVTYLGATSILGTL